MQIGIIGAGPVGSILGAYLSKGGQDVILVDILQEHLDVIKQYGLTISGLASLKAQVKDVCYNVTGLKQFTLDCLFICVKAPVLKTIMPEVKQVISDFTYVISFQNGADTEEVIAGYLGKAYILRVVINYAGNFIEPGHIRMSFFNKPNYIGAMSSETEAIAKKIAQMMTAAGLDTEVTSQIKKYVWEKVLLNSSISPVCALTGLTMQQAMDSTTTYHIIEENLREGIAVAEALGYKYDTDFLQYCMQYLRKAGHHKTSMNIDIENKRPTEIDFLNRKIVDYGKKNNIPTPYNDTMVALIKGKEDIY